jgi:hypothetical protein
MPELELCKVGSKQHKLRWDVVKKDIPAGLNLQALLDPQFCSRHMKCFGDVVDMLKIDKV